MAKFLVCGFAGTGTGRRPFEKALEAASEKMAREKAMTLLGSNAGIKRTAIEITSVEKI